MEVHHDWALSLICYARGPDVQKQAVLADGFIAAQLRCRRSVLGGFLCICPSFRGAGHCKACLRCIGAIANTLEDVDSVLPHPTHRAVAGLGDWIIRWVAGEAHKRSHGCGKSSSAACKGSAGHVHQISSSCARLSGAHPDRFAKACLPLLLYTLGCSPPALNV